MSQFAFYDFETTGTSPAFDQALQFAAILTDEDLNPLEEINVRCNLSDHILPSPIAFSVTGITPDVLNSQEMSYYDFSIYLYNLIARWSPSIWTGYNSISFDENFFRQMFYQNLLPEIYSTQFNGNKRFDLLRAVYACWGYGRANPAIPQLDNGKLTSKLDTLAPHNGFNEHNAHDALGDVRATIFVAKLIRDREPDIWNILMQNLDKDHLKSTFEAGNVLEIVERYGAGAPKRYQGVYCGESGSNRNQLGFFDLNQADAAAFANADIDQVKAAVEKSPKLIRTVDLNKMPLAFGVQNVTLKMGSDAAMVSANANLRALVGKALAERYADREEPEDVEQKIFGGFYSGADKALLGQFHKASWDQRLPIVNKINDVRLRELGMRLMVLYAPQCVDEAAKQEFWGLIGRRWSGEQFYGDRPKEPGNTYSSVAEDLQTLEPGGKFEVSPEDLAAYQVFFRQRKVP